MNPLPAARALDQYFLEARSSCSTWRPRSTGSAGAMTPAARTPMAAVARDQPRPGSAALRRAEQGGADPADLLAGLRPELEAAEAAVLIVGRI